MIDVYLNDDAVERFGLLAPTRPERFPSRPPRAWANTVRAGLGDELHLCTQEVQRDELRELWKADQSVHSLFWTTMAWGGMHRRHARTLAGQEESALRVCERLKRADITGTEAFEEFASLSTCGTIPGLGPAFFTKLIFFCCPTEDSFILDQWTACSVHLLTLQARMPAVVVSKRSEIPTKISAYVSNRVTAHDYGRFCEIVLELGERLGITGEEAEHRMFGLGGRQRTAWRQHVMENWHEVAKRSKS